jgi:hypothetical protein
MDKNNSFDYYDSVLITKEDIGKVMSANFLNLLSDLIFKYSDDINFKIQNRKEIESE